MKKKVLVSGVKPTGTIHIGNYFGAMRQNVEIGNSADYESYIFIANYHALTTMKGSRTEKLKSSTFDLACTYLAIGLDPEKVAFFKQSDVPEHTELCTIFNNIVAVPYLMRAHAFKAIEAENFVNDKLNESEMSSSIINVEPDVKSKSLYEYYESIVAEMEDRKLSPYNGINMGLMDYPVLMAADILMYHADIVPVGSDQKQHIEYARDIAGYFNRAWNVEYFKEPEDLIMDDVAIVPGTDARKMSKSYNNIIPLFGTDEEIRKAVMSIVTDAKAPMDVVNPDENNIYKIHKLFLNADENEDLRNRFLKQGAYAGGSYSYKQAKDALYEAIIAFVRPMRERYDYYQSHPDEVQAILADGAARARTRARATMDEVRRLVGLT